MMTVVLTVGVCGTCLAACLLLLQVFQQYLQYVREKQAVCQAEEDLVAGLQVYFDKALYQSLLFKAERRQADQVMEGITTIPPGELAAQRPLLGMFSSEIALLSARAAITARAHLSSGADSSICSYMPL